MLFVICEAESVYQLPNKEHFTAYRATYADPGKRDSCAQFALGNDRRRLCFVASMGSVFTFGVPIFPTPVGSRFDFLPTVFTGLLLYSAFGYVPHGEL